MLEVLEAGGVRLKQVLLEELRKFCRLQTALVAEWRAQCGDSHDLELLLDFPKRSQFEMDGRRWEAVKHGRGVMFCAEDLVVDVPHGIGCPEVFEPDRFFDYLTSQNLLDFLGEEGADRRERLAQLFLEWSNRGLLERRTDEHGRSAFSLAASSRATMGER